MTGLLDNLTAEILLLELFGHDFKAPLPRQDVNIEQLEELLDMCGKLTCLPVTKLGIGVLVVPDNYRLAYFSFRPFRKISITTDHVSNRVHPQKISLFQ